MGPHKGKTLAIVLVNFPIPDMCNLGNCSWLQRFHSMVSWIQDRNIMAEGYGERKLLALWQEEEQHGR